MKIDYLDYKEMYKSNCAREMKKEKEILQRELKNLKKTFDCMNSHLLKGVATMAELTKTDARQPLGKIKPTDKIVMLLGLFDGTKPEASKQHYERFNMHQKLSLDRSIWRSY